MPGEASYRTRSSGGAVVALCDEFESAWRRGETPQIEDYLAKSPPELWLQLLDELVRIEIEYRSKLGPTPSMEEYLAKYASFASRAGTESIVGHSTIDSPSPADPDATHVHGVAPAEAPSSADDAAVCGRFQIVKPHARGGLGEVFVARDGELHRNVALKRIRDRFVDDDGSRARFLREAEITGNLEHPGIVPIYALGTDADGRPYYAMRFIQGDTLKEAIEQFHSSSLPPSERGLELRKLLRRFLDVCNAVDYAHSRGVLHRDLKPANIMIGKYGETLVVDWGLAKPIGRGETNGRADEATLVPQSDAEATQMGAAVGTPQYMSPEQAAGRHDELTPAADVYSLGGVLYSILTGKPPITGGTVGELLQNVMQGAIRPPHAVHPEVPRPLESICLKALALKPQDRYATARALADDVEKWLADERVAAHRETLNERTARWIRTHRTAVVGATALTATAVIALVVGLIAVTREQRETEKQRQTAEIKQREAETAQAKEAAERKRADDERDAAEWTAYLANIQAADAEWERNQAASARLHLDACPPRLRGWEHAYLANKFQRGVTTFHGHGGMVNNVAFSPDGKQIISAAADQTVKIRNADTGQEILTLRGHSGTVMDAACSADGKRIVSGSSDKTVKVWDAVTGRELLTLRGHSGAVPGVALSPDGKRIASGSFDETVKIWNADSGQEFLTLSGHTAWIQSVAFSPDGERLVSGSNDGTAKIWNLDAGREMFTLHGSGAVSSAAFSPDGARIITAGGDGKIRVWDAKTGKPTLTLIGHANSVDSVAFSADGQRIVSGSRDQTVKIWDADAGQQTLTLRGHSGYVNGVAFSPDGKRVVSGGVDNTVKSWDAVAGHETQTLRGHSNAVWSVAFSPDGDRIVSASYDGTAKIWNADTGTATLTFHGHTAQVLTAAFSPDGRRVVSGSQDKSVRVWDADTGRETLAIEHSNAVRSLFFSTDGKRIVGGPGNAAMIWDAETGLVDRSRPGYHNRVNDPAISPDGKRIAAVGNDETIKVYDTTSRQVLLTLRGHTGKARCAAFSPDGRRIATGAYDQTLKIWDAATGHETLTLRGHTGIVHCLAFSPDGKRIVSGSSDRIIKIWDATPPVPSP